MAPVAMPFIATASPFMSEALLSLETRKAKVTLLAQQAHYGSTVRVAKGKQGKAGRKDQRCGAGRVVVMVAHSRLERETKRL